MITRLVWLISLVCCFSAAAQKVTHIYKVDDLLKRIKNPDTTYVVNFWATWCKPCIKELPAFDSLYIETTGRPVKIILVSMDFKEDLENKVNPFLTRKQLKPECVLLDEINGNVFIDKIAKEWTGAIPATLVKHGSKTQFAERSLHLQDLQRLLLETSH